MKLLVDRADLSFLAVSNFNATLVLRKPNTQTKLNKRIHYSLTVPGIIPKPAWAYVKQGQTYIGTKLHKSSSVTSRTADTHSYLTHASPLLRHGDSLGKVTGLVHIMPSQQREMVTEKLQWYNIHNGLNALINFWDLHAKAAHILVNSS